ncbi:TonB-dependent receptor [Acidicapsa acidisoli]|uniref:TonB-dependent receptor n=1 Tax=Acidicapsa acidisoli TaxID=1615681 RepID=UPI0021E08A4D|nr:TonB-dependent receptor [Acidicapsa acidisoli]
MQVLRNSLSALLVAASLCGGVFVSTFTPPSALAQADLGAISGIITDASGAVIGNATVTVTNSGTGAVRSTVTNSKGEYAVTQLNAGDYSLSISASGFANATDSLRVTVGSTIDASIKLAVAGSKTEVIVSADDSASVHLESAQVSTVITPEEINSLPLADRDAYGLVSLSGNVSADPTAAMRGVGFNIAGGRSSSVDILLDGAENTDLYAVGIGQQTPLDAVQEFSVVTASEGAEFGRASSGAVNVSTKSGTNKFHGDVYEYNRISTFASDGFNNNALFAAGDLANPKSRYVHNQFGYFVGGPIKKDKLFFSSATEWTRIRSAATVVAEVPLPGLIAFAAPNMQSYFSTYGAALAHPVNGQSYTGQDLINEGVFASDVIALSATNPAILTTPLFGTVAYQNPGDSGGGEPQNTWNNFNRIDYNISDKTSLYGRYSQYNQLEFAGTNNTSPYAGYNTGTTQKNYNLLVSITHSFTSTLASNTKVLLTRFNNAQPLGSVPVSPTLYVNGSTSVALGSGTIYFPGYLPTSPGNAIPFGGPQNFIQVGDDLSWTKGRHNIKFGGEFLNVKDNRVFGAYENAVDALKQTGTKGALQNFVSGNLGEIEVALNPNGVYPCSRDVNTGATIVTSACEIALPATQPNFSRSNRYQDGALYAADSYHATSRLTLSAGLRWEVYGPQHSQRPGLDANFFLGSGGSEYEDIRNGQILTRVNAPNGRLWNLNLLQFGPRIGLAYDLTGDGKTSLRAGYGLSYERNFNNVTFNVIQNPPNYAVVALIGSSPISTNNLGTFGTGSGSVALPNTTLRAVDPKIKPAYAENWTVSLERQIDPSTLITAGYVASRGIHNYSIANLNREFAGGNYLGDANFSNRLNLQYSNINWRGADGDSYYESVNLGIRSNNLRRTGLGMQANYTFGHSIDNTSSTFTDGESNIDNLGYLDPFNKGLDRGNSDFDVRHRVTAAVWWNVPFFNHGSGLTKAVFGGWNAATTFNAVTGNPYTIFDCGYAFTQCPRVSFIGYKKPAGLSKLQDISSTFGPNTYSYQNLPAYTDAAGNANYNEQLNPGSGTSDTPLPGGAGLASGGFVRGMTGRNAFSGPGSWGENFIASKNIAIHERYSIKLSATFINVFNHANTFLNLDGTNDVSSFSNILAFKGESASGNVPGNRNTELEAKFVF